MRFRFSCAAALATVLVLFAAFHSVRAQNTGDRVRVVIAGDTLTGEVTETSETGFSMTLSTGLMSGYEVRRDVEYRQVETLEVKTCCMDYAQALVTAGGLFLGAGLGEQTNQETCSETVILLPFPLPTVSETCTREGNNELWGGLIGGALGLVVGITILREKWELIPHNEREGTSLAPLVGIRSGYQGSAMILGTRIRF